MILSIERIFCWHGLYRNAWRTKDELTINTLNLLENREKNRLQINKNKTKYMYVTKSRQLCEVSGLDSFYLNKLKISNI